MGATIYEVFRQCLGAYLYCFHICVGAAGELAAYII